MKRLKLFWCADRFDYFLSVMFIAVYLLSPYFACALPCCSFVEISPDVILRDEVRNVRICSTQNNRSIIKPRGWDFATTPTRFKVLNDYFRFVRVTSVRMLLVCNLFIFFTNSFPSYYIFAILCALSSSLSLKYP